MADLIGHITSGTAFGSALNKHINDEVRHITKDERKRWNASASDKAEISKELSDEFIDHMDDKNIHFTNGQKTKLLNDVDDLRGDVDNLASLQIPENIVKKTVEDYANAHSAGFATKTDIGDLYDGLENTYQTFINNTGTDWSLNDAYTDKMCATPIFTSSGKIVIKFDEHIVGIGLNLYVISKTSGSFQSWELDMTTITETEYEIDVDDEVRVLIQAVGGIEPYYDRIVKGTTIYTLSNDELIKYLKNKIIGNKKIWCFGDSLTAGVITGTTTIEESYPHWLGEFVGNHNNISNYGVPGDTASNMYNLIKTKDFTNCDIAILMIGANGFLSDYESDSGMCSRYKLAIEHIINSSHGVCKIILMNTPKSHRDGIPQRWLDETHYNTMKIANDYRLDCIDLFNYLPFDVNNRTYYSVDKTHFTKVGYYYIAFIIYNYLTNNMIYSMIGGNPVFNY